MYPDGSLYVVLLCLTSWLHFGQGHMPLLCFGKQTKRSKAEGKGVKGKKKREKKMRGESGDERGR